MAQLSPSLPLPPLSHSLPPLSLCDLLTCCFSTTLVVVAVQSPVKFAYFSLLPAFEIGSPLYLSLFVSECVLGRVGVAAARQMPNAVIEN